jgi:hypothetical protein
MLLEIVRMRPGFRLRRPALPTGVPAIPNPNPLLSRGIEL